MVTAIRMTPAHGHAIYGMNNLGGLKTIARNLFFKQFGKYTIHLYTEGSNALKDFHCIDNVICGHPVHTGGGLGLSNFLYDGNWQYQAWCSTGSLFRSRHQPGCHHPQQFIDSTEFPKFPALRFSNGHRRKTTRFMIALPGIGRTRCIPPASPMFPCPPR